jgi:hypothetical protein
MAVGKELGELRDARQAAAVLRFTADEFVIWGAWRAGGTRSKHGYLGQARKASLDSDVDETKREAIVDAMIDLFLLESQPKPQKIAAEVGRWRTEQRNVE